MFFCIVQTKQQSCNNMRLHRGILKGHRNWNHRRQPLRTRKRLAGPIQILLILHPVFKKNQSDSSGKHTSRFPLPPPHLYSFTTRCRGIRILLYAGLSRSPNSHILTRKAPEYRTEVASYRESCVCILKGNQPLRGREWVQGSGVSPSCRAYRSVTSASPHVQSAFPH